jgi:hypothetical protein
MEQETDKATKKCESYEGPEDQRTLCTADAIGRYRSRRVVSGGRGLLLCAQHAREYVLRFGWRHIGKA